ARNGAAQARLLAETARDGAGQARAEAERRRGDSMAVSHVSGLTQKRRGLRGDQTPAIADEQKSSPEDVGARIKLIGYYMMQRNNPDAKESFQAHVIWLIEHQPRNPVFLTGDARLHHRLHGDAYIRAKAIWAKQVEANPRDTVVLANAAAFLLLG